MRENPLYWTDESAVNLAIRKLLELSSIPSGRWFPDSLVRQLLPAKVRLPSQSSSKSMFFSVTKSVTYSKFHHSLKLWVAFKRKAVKRGLENTIDNLNNATVTIFCNIFVTHLCMLGVVPALVSVTPQVLLLSRHMLCWLDIG